MTPTPTSSTRCRPRALPRRRNAGCTGPKDEFCSPAAPPEPPSPPRPCPNRCGPGWTVPHPGIRIGAVIELGEWLASGDPARAATARRHLQEVADTDIPRVAQTARTLLDTGTTAEPPTPAVLHATAPATAPQPTPVPVGPSHLDIQIRLGKIVIGNALLRGTINAAMLERLINDLDSQQPESEACATVAERTDVSELKSYLQSPGLSKQDASNFLLEKLRYIRAIEARGPRGLQEERDRVFTVSAAIRKDTEIQAQEAAERAEAPGPEHVPEEGWEAPPFVPEEGPVPEAEQEEEEEEELGGRPRN